MLEGSRLIPNDANDAFRHEFLFSCDSELIRLHLISYLGEYRLKIPRYQYRLMLINGQLVDPVEKRSLILQGENAIRRRQLERKSISREEAELLGLTKLQDQLQMAHLGDIIIWCSPPGPKEDGYGDYGFVYLGQIINQDELGNKKLSMNALRIEKPTFPQFNNYLKSFGVGVEFTCAEDFLANPIIYSPSEISLNIEDYINSLSDYFEFDNSDEKSQMLWQLIEKLNPYIEMYIQTIKNGDSIQAQAILNTMENLSLMFRDKYLIDQLPLMPVHYVIEAFKYTPPLVAGSCGASASVSPFNSPIQNIFSKLGLENLEINRGERYPDYQCPNCGETIQGEIKDRPKTWKTKCPYCGYKFNCRK